ncbi:MAG: hypothetical protein IJ306_03540 [Oscillospiraceae bacterium]|nr:hypothetical protein [Oscillospiraceae bacterium]
MFKKLSAMILAVMMAVLLCACESEIPPEKENPVSGQENISPQEKEQVNPSEASKAESSEQEEEPAETEVPTADMIERIYLEMGEKSLADLSERQKEIIKKLLQPENWVEAENFESVNLSGETIFESCGGFIRIGFSEGKSVVTLEPGGKQRVFYAPEKVASDIGLFRQKYELSQKVFETMPEPSSELKEYDEKYLCGGYFATAVGQEYDEENYFKDNILEMMFRHVFELSQKAGIVGEDVYDPYYPKKLVEELISHCYLWNEEDIRNNAGDFPEDENGTYHFAGEYGGAYPMLMLADMRENGDETELYVDLYSSADENINGYHLLQSSVLTIRSNGDGTWKYLSIMIYFYRFYEEVN